MRNITARRRPLFSVGTTRRHRPDYSLIVISLLLMGIGLIVVYAISPGLAAQNNVSDYYYVGKQVVAIGLGIIAFAVVASLPLRAWRKLEIPLLVLAAAASVAVRFFGEKVNGAYRWIQIGGLSFQVAELIKFALLIWLAGFLADRIRTKTVGDARQSFKPMLVALVFIGAVVAILQRDFGSTGVMIVMMAAMMLVAGWPMKRLLMIGAIAIIGMILVILPFSYRRARLANFINPTRDCQNTGYQACQALIAVGSGGTLGLGLARGVQAYGYLPEAANDSIFAIFAEKFGFVGCTLLITLFGALFVRLAKIMEKSSDDYSKLLVAGILAWLSTQAIINIGAMLGILPLKGITLPFISYGGTSIIFVTAAIGLAFNISRYTSYGTNTNTQERTSNNDPFGRRRDRRPYYATPRSSQ